MLHTNNYVHTSRLTISKNAVVLNSFVENIRVHPQSDDRPGASNLSVVQNQKASVPDLLFTKEGADVVGQSESMPII